MKRKFVGLFLVFVIFVGCLPNVAWAININDDEVFLKQQTSYTCTLASAAMMLRRRAILNGNSNWDSITESAMRSTAWIENQGLRGSFSYAGMNVTQVSLSGDKKSQLISVLNAHPEGIEVYNKSHAVLITDYTDGTFYCGDPSYASYIPKSRIPLTSSYLKGGTQDGIINNLTSYWYITNYSGGGDTTPPTVKSFYVTDINSNSFKIICSADEILSRAYIIVYGPGGKSGQGFDVTNINSSSFSKVINTSDYGGCGDYTVHAYIFDTSGNEAGCASKGFTVSKISIENFTAYDITSASFTLSCKANNIISRAYIIVYGPGGKSGQGFDITNINSTSFRQVINTADYGGAGQYIAHIYIFDSGGNEAAGATNKFQIEPLKVENYMVSNITNSSFTLNCVANSKISRAYVIVYGPGGKSGQGFDITNINSSSFKKTINLSDYGGAGRYVAHTYIFDSSGNEAPAATPKFYAPLSVNPQDFTILKYSNSTTVINNTTKSQQATVIIAQYSGKALKNKIIKTVTFGVNEEKIFNHSYGSDYKVFIWDSLSNMKPLAN